ncbi:hypothetical protein PIB30_009058 [Stylosanthes scabra]|uniref:Uncharacterized protein n=1 Tax=Stylosanthes scabra TaxID=79078 RepID=A0ABU6V438_9FABA|nr:hypothetical protein [Stylosanthes scabra]
MPLELPHGVTSAVTTTVTTTETNCSSPPWPSLPSNNPPEPLFAQPPSISITETCAPSYDDKVEREIELIGNLRSRSIASTRGDAVLGPGSSPSNLLGEVLTFHQHSKDPASARVFSHSDQRRGSERARSTDRSPSTSLVEHQRFS